MNALARSLRNAHRVARRHARTMTELVKDTHARYTTQDTIKHCTRFIQLNDYSCFARCVQMVLNHHDQETKYSEITEALGTDKDGTSESRVIRYLRQRKFCVSPRERLSMTVLSESLQKGALVIAYVDTDHAIVVYGMDSRYIYLADPSISRAPNHRYTQATFQQRFDRAGLIVWGPRK